MNQEIYTRDSNPQPYEVKDAFSIAPLDYDVIVMMDRRDFIRPAVGMKKAVDLLNNLLYGKVIFMVSAYVDEDEYPVDEYWYPNLVEEEEGKELLPLHDILEAESKIIEEADDRFKSINDWCTLEYSIPYVWTGNNVGQHIVQEAIRLAKESLV